MKNIIILFVILTSPITVFTQDEAVKSDLRIKVDSIIEYQLKPQVDTSFNSVYVNGYKRTDVIIRKSADYYDDELPLIILDMRKVTLDDLDHYQFKNISFINVLNKNDKTAFALYGASAVNGIIIIETQRKLFKKRKRH